MIRLTKLPKPQVLVRNAESWTKVILEKLARSEKPTKADRSKYNHDDVKKTLVEETKGKCAYCESQVRHIAYGDIEHISPKTPNPALWFDWDNLTLACDICNTNKGDHENLLDPYSVDPTDHLVFLGNAIWARPGNEVAELTVRLLDLNRDELVGKRQERIEHLMALLKVIATAKDDNLRKLLKQDFNNELEDGKEYAAMSRILSKDLLASIP